MVSIAKGPGIRINRDEQGVLSHTLRSCENAVRSLGSAMELIEKTSDEKLLLKLSSAYVAAHAARVAAQTAYDRLEEKSNDSDRNATSTPKRDHSH